MSTALLLLLSHMDGPERDTAWDHCSSSSTNTVWFLEWGSRKKPNPHQLHLSVVTSETQNKVSAGPYEQVATQPHRKQILRFVNRGLEVSLLGNSMGEMTTWAHIFHCTSCAQGRRAQEVRHHVRHWRISSTFLKQNSMYLPLKTDASSCTLCGGLAMAQG